MCISTIVLFFLKEKKGRYCFIVDMVSPAWVLDSHNNPITRKKILRSFDQGNKIRFFYNAYFGEVKLQFYFLTVCGHFVCIVL